LNTSETSSQDPVCQPLLQVERLQYRYPSGQTALQDVSFVVYPGERIGLLGPNGAGKTTLLMHLNGLLPETGVANQSAVKLGELAVVPKHFREIRRRVGFLFQDPDDQLFCPTVVEDIAFGPLNLGLEKEEIRSRVMESLDAVGLTGFEGRYTQQLSFGERKRVALAGVLACRPDLLVMDEPTSNLDLRARRRFIEILKQTSASQLIATHDLELVLEQCSRVIVLDQGRIQADGSPREILSNRAFVERHGLEVPLSLQS